MRWLAVLASLVLLATACGDDGDETTSDDGADEAESESEEGGTLTIYSGRNEELVGPLLDMFEEDTGTTVEVRYGDTTEMAGAILEEGDNSPADVFFGQDAGALGALANEDRLTPLDDEVLDLVEDRYQSTDGEWVGVSARARTVVYNTDTLTEDDLPDSILDFTDDEWSGRIGWAPTNGSFQAYVTALRELEGDDGARAWLEGIQANDPTVFDGNTPIVEAVAAGEIDVGFVNHYYALQLQAEDPDFAADNKFYFDGDPGALVNVAGAGVVDTADDPDLASEFIEYLLSDTAQSYFATETYEIPLVGGIETDESVPDLMMLEPPDLDLSDLDDLEATLALLTEVGLL